MRALSGSIGGVSAIRGNWALGPIQEWVVSWRAALPFHLDWKLKSRGTA